MDNVGTVINNLTALVVTTNETADQNEDNLQVVRTVLTQTATHLQTASVPLAVVEQVSYVQVYSVMYSLLDAYA